MYVQYNSTWSTPNYIHARVYERMCTCMYTFPPVRVSFQCVNPKPFPRASETVIKPGYLFK